MSLIFVAKSLQNRFMLYAMQDFLNSSLSYDNIGLTAENIKVENNETAV